MSRIDIQTLVLAFEKRISELNKNPPNVVSDKVINVLLENAISEEIENNFREKIKTEIKDLMKQFFKKENNRLIKETLRNILNDNNFKHEISLKIQCLLLASLK